MNPLDIEIFGKDKVKEQNKLEVNPNVLERIE